MDSVSNTSLDFDKDASPKDADEPSTPEIGKYIRDADFYFYDGNCVLLAENRLFRVHKSLLSREPSFFRELLTMYSLPQDSRDDDEDMEVCKELDTSVTNRCLEGESDENPIICQDTARGIRDLCWALYASPGEIIQQQSYESINLNKIIRVLEMAHKYQFENLQNWALNTIHNAFKDCHQKNLKLLTRCKTMDKFETLFKLVHACNHVSLINHTQEELLWRLKRAKKGLPVHLKFFSDVLLVVDKVPSLRLFRGKVFHTLLCSMDVFYRQASHRRSYDTAISWPMIQRHTSTRSWKTQTSKNIN